MLVHALARDGSILFRQSELRNLMTALARSIARYVLTDRLAGAMRFITSL